MQPSGPRQGAVRGDGPSCTCRRASLGGTRRLWAEAAFQVAAPAALGFCRRGWVLSHRWRQRGAPRTCAGIPRGCCRLWGRGCVSLAMVQIAIRSPCWVGGQGCLLAVPQTVAKVDAEACGPRAEVACEQSRLSSPGSVTWLTGKPLHAACPGPAPRASSPRGPTFCVWRNDMTLRLRPAAVTTSPLHAVRALPVPESLTLGRVRGSRGSCQAGEPSRGATPAAPSADHLAGAPWPLVGAVLLPPGWDFQWAPRLPRLFVWPP